MKSTIIIALLLLATLCAADSLHVSLIGHIDTPGSALEVYVYGSYAYVADHVGGLRVIDISTPTAPVEVGYYDTGGRAMGVVVSGYYAYIADCSSGFLVIDVSDPSTPFLVGSSTGDLEVGVYLSGSYAYLVGVGLDIIDISSPSSPSEVGFYDFDTDNTVDVYVSGSYAYVANFFYGLHILDVSSASSPSELGFYDGHFRNMHVCVSGSYAYTTGNDFRVIDVSSPSSPYEVGSYARGGEDVYVSGNYAYIAAYMGFDYGGLSIIDISSPTSPSEVGFYGVGFYAYGVYVSGDYSYVASGDSGLYILDISYFTGIEENSPSAKPEAFAISAYPNPFNSAVIITVSGEATSPLQIEVFDINGRRINVIARSASDEAISPNNRSSDPLDTRRDAVSINNCEFVWQPDAAIGSGVYLVRATVGPSTGSGTETATARVVYLK